MPNQKCTFLSPCEPIYCSYYETAHGVKTVTAPVGISELVGQALMTQLHTSATCLPLFESARSRSPTVY